MLENWNNAIITDIILAVYVFPETGATLPANRPSHGFVINDSKAEKIITFSDGTVLKAGPNEVHYLPKGSNYRVNSIIPDGCWAINFNLLEDIIEKPFCINFRNHESILKNFKEAAAAWKEKTDISNSVIRKNIHEIIIKIKKEQQRSYMPSKKEMLIKPALDIIKKDFTKNDLSVKELSELCGISEAYFRRLFIDKFGITPKDHIINRRIEYAKSLLLSGQFQINEIAEMCGYSEPCHFSREFSRHAGTSPKKYKMRNFSKL